MNEVLKIVIACALTAIVVAFVAWKFAIAYRIKVVEAKTCSAEEKAREIIDEALKTAETKKKEALLEAKEEALKNKNSFLVTLQLSSPLFGFTFQLILVL